MDENIRTLTKVICPCCGITVPVEIVLHARPIEQYIEYLAAQDYGTDEDERKTWPIIHLEIDIDTKSLLENPVEVEKYHKKLVSIGMAEPITP
jgi:hypothetical protein